MNNKSYVKNHCCDHMVYALEDYQKLLNYDAKYREYGLKIPGHTGCLIMDYCPFCGVKLPSSLRKQWGYTLRNDYLLEDPIEKDKSKIPQEFLTDQWWKKRRL